MNKLSSRFPGDSILPCDSVTMRESVGLVVVLQQNMVKEPGNSTYRGSKSIPHLLTNVMVCVAEAALTANAKVATPKTRFICSEVSLDLYLCVHCVVAACNLCRRMKSALTLFISSSRDWLRYRYQAKAQYRN
jgi:hypothetical protein